jgi:hypothetical protein
MKDQSTNAAAALVTQQEAETRFFTSTRHTLTKKTTLLQDRKGAGSDRQVETRDGQPVLSAMACDHLHAARRRCGGVVARNGHHCPQSHRGLEFISVWPRTITRLLARFKRRP